MADIDLSIKTFDKKDEFSKGYGVLSSFDEVYSDLSNSDLKINNADVDLEIQEFYDGSVNLILNDEDNLRIINSGFNIEDNKLQKVIRNNKFPANKYSEKNVNTLTSLILHSDNIPIIDYEVLEGGNLMGGNYFFYIKYGTSDKDVTDILEESRVISIFNGHIGDPKTISGTLVDERTNKSIKLSLDNIDPNFSKIYLLYTRNSSDINGIKTKKTYKIVNGYNINDNSKLEILITGDEEIQEIDSEELNINYLFLKGCKSIVQHESRLFIAGTKSDDSIFDKRLEEISKNAVLIKAVRRYLYNEDKKYDESIDYHYIGNGYYNPKNISNKLGYWPEEFYRLGIVYVYNTGETSCVYNLKGGLLKVNEDYIEGNSSRFINDFGIFYITDYNFYQEYNKDPYIQLTAEVNFSKEIKSGEDISDFDYVKKHNIKSYFIVRQNRIPLNYAQGVVCPVENNSGFPGLKYKGPKVWHQNNNKKARLFEFDSNTEKLWLESFLQNVKDFWATRFGERHYCTDEILEDRGWYARLFDFKNYHYGILSLDAYCVKQLQSLFANNNFYIYPVGIYTNTIDAEVPTGDERKVIPENDLAPYDLSLYSDKNVETSLVYIPKETPSIYFNDLQFSTKAGSAEDALSVSYVDVDSNWSGTLDSKLTKDQLNNSKNNPKNKRYNASILRGTATPFIGVTSSITNTLKANQLVTIRSTKYLYTEISNIDNKTYKDLENLINRELEKRKQDRSAFAAITPRQNIDNKYVMIFGGDCFINVQTLRMQTNFIDPDVQLNDIPVGKVAKVDGVVNWLNNQLLGKIDAICDTWVLNYKGINQSEATNKENINRADINAAKIGTWYTFKCRSNYNMGLRSEDKTHTDEINKMGNWRSFYPKRDINPKAAGKIPESDLLNLGLSTVLSEKRYYNLTSKDIPYSQTIYNNRVLFSNPYIQGNIDNGYRVFQGLSYKDYTREYGSITKLLPLGQNLFVVFEFGCGVIPINEKALVSTTEGQQIHMYGAGVLGDQISVISHKYGSRWKSSIISTPNGIYGVDTDNKVIWRYNQRTGFVIISDLKIKSYLNSKMSIGLDTFKVLNGIKQIRTHYNSDKNDVLFTFCLKKQDNGQEITWNLCYNERIDTFICRYTWIPLLSETVDNTFYSFNLNDSALKDAYYEWKDNKNLKNILPKEGDRCFLWQHWSENNKDSKDVIKPTNWYNIQSPFEFEFIVNQPLGLHKVFDNLVIISNNAEPESLDITVVGDVYDFNKNNIFIAQEDNKELIVSFPKITLIPKKENSNKEKQYNTKVIFDEITKEHKLCIHQDILNITDYGRRLGNIHYTEDKWNVILQPIYYKEHNILKSTRIRDKYAKIRIRYNGEKLAVITSIQTLFRLSYA